MRIIKIVVGLLCVLVAFWPASLAFTLVVDVIIPKLTTAPGVFHATVIVFDHSLRGWELYTVPLVAALVAVGLLAAGLNLVMSKSHDAG